MGQALLEGCQKEPQFGNNQQIKSLYIDNRLADFPDFTNSIRSSIVMNESRYSCSFVQKTKILPNSFIQYATHLFFNRLMHEDHTFKPRKSIFQQSNSDAPLQWERLSNLQTNKKQLATLSKHQLGKQSNKSNLFQLYKYLTDFPQLLLSIQPKYLPQIGLAVCQFQLNGLKQEVLIDDYIPVIRFIADKDLPADFLLIEKAFAKVLGSYEFINKFTVSELFTELTGLPFQNENENTLSTRQKSVSSFTDVLRNSHLLIKKSSAKGDVCVMRYRQHYKLTSVRLPLKAGYRSIFSFYLDEESSVSLRVSRLHNIYTNSIDECSRALLIEVYKVSAENYILGKIDATNTIGNNIYVGEGMWQKFSPGKYLIYVLNLQAQRKVSLVGYANPALDLLKQQHMLEQWTAVINEFNYNLAKINNDTGKPILYKNRLFVSLQHPSIIQIISPDYSMQSFKWWLERRIDCQHLKQRLLVFINREDKSGKQELEELKERKQKRNRSVKDNNLMSKIINVRSK